MSDDLDRAIVRVANARRISDSARTLAKAAEEARVAAYRDLATAESELHEMLNERIDAHNAG